MEKITKKKKIKVFHILTLVILISIMTSIVAPPENVLSESSKPEVQIVETQNGLETTIISQEISSDLKIKTPYDNKFNIGYKRGDKTTIYSVSGYYTIYFKNNSGEVEILDKFYIDQENNKNLIKNIH